MILTIRKLKSTTDFALSTILFAVLLLITQQSAMANKNENELALTELHQNIEAILNKQNIPGFAYAIVEQDKTPIVEVFGHHSLNKQIPININTPFRLASVSKLVVGIAAMQQIEQGNLALDDRLDVLLPWLEYTNEYNDSHPILLKHLLENTTGWNETSLKERAIKGDAQMPLKSVLNISSKSRKSRWQPGTRHAYTNTAATVVAAIIEETTGQDFYQYVQNEIFTPLNINSASYLEQSNAMPLGHQGKQTMAYNEIIMAPSGALNMSIVDLAKLANEFVSARSILLSKQSIARMELSATTNAGDFAAGYGIYNYARYYDGVRYRGHDGALKGWLSELSYSPKYNTGFVVLQNSENGRAFREVINLIHAYLAASYNTDVIANASDAVNSQLSGYYRVTNPRVDERWFLERLVTSHKLTASDNNAKFTSVFPKGWVRELVYIGSGQWVNSQNEVVMKVANDPILGEVLHYGDRVFKKESGFFALIDKLVLLVWLLLLISFMIMSMIWLIKRLRGKLLLGQEDEVARRKQRKNIMLALLGPLLFLLFLVLGILSPVERLGSVTVFSLGLFASTLLMFAGTLYSSFVHVKTQQLIKAKVLFVLASIYLLLQLCITFYLLNFGVIGVMTWL
jgi:CubicO group peptidase (beta-lactamase class C family)